MSVDWRAERVMCLRFVVLEGVESHPLLLSMLGVTWNAILGVYLW